jgi:hypothetical protein
MISMALRTIPLGRSYPGVGTRERPVRLLHSCGGRPAAWRDVYVDGCWAGEVVKVERDGKRGWLPIGVRDLADIEVQPELSRAARMLTAVAAVQVFIHPETNRAKQVLIERFKDQIDERRCRRPDHPGTASQTYHYVTVFECPHGHQHRDVLQAAICIGRRECES